MEQVANVHRAFDIMKVFFLNWKENLVNYLPVFIFFSFSVVAELLKFKKVCMEQNGKWY
jgi:hypothetical protein